MRKAPAALAAIILLLGSCSQPQEAQVTDKPKMMVKINNDTKYDIDLKDMNANIVYATVYQMTQQPQTYMGMTVRIDGLYSEEKSDVNDNTYHYCIIPDAAACCQQGIEFILNNSSEYPAVDTQIELIGTFRSYQEGPYEYYYIDTTEMTQL